MNDIDIEFAAYVVMTHGELERLDYYRLLEVERDAPSPQIKEAFYGIAARFHPDRNRSADQSIQKALYDIFKRVNEAYRVLCNVEQRKLYDQGLKQGKMRLDLQSRRGGAVQNPADSIKSLNARQFYTQAAEALKKGQIVQAELCIKVALGHDRNNQAIRALFGEIQVAKRKP